MKRTVRDIRGMTLIEVLMVVAILGLLVVVLGFSFQGWIAKYKVEDQTKRLYADITDARARSMQKKRMTFVVFTLSENRYRTFEDTNTAPDGDGQLIEAADTRVVDATTDYPIVPALTGGVERLAFDRDGLASVTGTIWLDSTLSPDYDCITIRTTRIRIGRYDGASATCQEK